MSTKLFSLRPWKECTVTLYRTGTDYRGAATVEVIVTDKGQQIFGPDTKGMRLTGALSPFHDTDSAYAKHYALYYAGIKPGDTDREFFKNYTPTQLAWAEKHGDDLKMIATDRYGED